MHVLKAHSSCELFKVTQELLSNLTGVGMNLSPLASKLIWLPVVCLFWRFLMCFLFASNSTLFLLLRVFLRLCLRILFDILFAFSLCLRLRYSENKQVNFSACSFVISCNFANISMHWPSFSMKVLAILFTFLVSAVRLDSDCTTLLFLAVSFESFGLLPRCSSLLKLMSCLWWKGLRPLIKSSSARLRMRLTSFLNCSSALTLAHALYRKDAEQDAVAAF